MNESFNTRFRELVAKHPMTQRAIAKHVNVSQGSVSGWLRGTTLVPDAETVQKIAKLFGVSTSWLLYGEGGLTSSPVFTNCVPVGRFKILNGEAYFIEEEQQEFGFISNKDSYKAIRLNDSRMQPTLTEGDILIIDTELTDVEVRALYALFIGQRFIVANVDLSLTGEVVVSTTNPPESVALKEPPVIVGKVVKRISEV